MSLSKNLTRNRTGSWLTSLIILPVLIILIISTASVNASDPIDVGYRDFSYPNGTANNDQPTAQKPESKLWWNDGYWWGSMWSGTSGSGAYFIHKLDLQNQDWDKKSTQLDDRIDTRADVLWDGQKLYVVSHVFASTGAASADPNEWGRLYRYSYDTVLDTYSLDSGFPITVTQGESETLVIARDSIGTLWVTYVQQDSDGKYKVWVNHSRNGNDSDWGDPYVLPVAGGADDVKRDDIASIISYEGHVGIMWSNQHDKDMYFAIHQDGASANIWDVIAAYTASADDHISLKSLESDGAGKVFAVVKTELTNSSAPQIVLVVCDNGNCTSSSDWGAHTVYKVSESNPTRPIMLLDTSNREIYVFVALDGGDAIYYKVSDMDNILFPSGVGTPFIESSSDTSINDPTSTKQNLDCSTGLVVLASDHHKNRYYHNHLDLCPVPTPTVQFSTANYTVNEDVGTATITVTLDTESTSDVTVDYAVSSGTATSPADFTAVPATQLTIPDGSTSATFDVSIVNDDLGEEDETVNLTLSSPNGATLGTPSSSTLHIIDDEGTPSVQFASSTYSVNEDGGPAEIEVTLSHASAVNAVTVNYATSDGTAVAGSDYTAASGVLTFAIGDTSETITVPITNDGLAELDQTVNLALSSPGHGSLGTPSTAVLTIVDDDPTPTVNFSSSQYNVDEDAGVAAITVELSAPFEETVTVNYTTADGTAVAGEDYTAASGQIIFASSEISQTFNVTITEDIPDEAIEDFQVALSSPTYVTLGTQAVAVVNIIDNYPPVAVDDSNTTDEDHMLSVTGTGVLANDYDPDGLEVTVIDFSDSSAFGAAVSIEPGGSYTYDPRSTPPLQALGNGESVDDSFSYTISDNNNLTSTATVSITVKGINDFPTAVDDTAFTEKNVNVAIHILDNDSDPENDLLIIDSWSLATNGVVTLQDDVLVYTPRNNYFGTDSFTYIISDGHGGSANAAVTVTVGHTQYIYLPMIIRKE